MNKISSLSVSVVICCYNSETRLPETLRHLVEQEVPEGISWEVIVVDNASTDNTAQVARSLWPDDAPAPMRVVSEPEPGLSHARKRGFMEAKHELVSFVDDDNWLAPDWVRRVAEIMNDHPEVGACGGSSEAVFETSPPFWFDRFQRSYAVGSQSDTTGDITWNAGWNESHLWGAGLTVRKAAWQQLRAVGFLPNVVGRTGSSLSSGEDYELCDALRLSGWKLWYEPALHMKHFITRQRLTWSYHKKLHQGFGASNAGIDPYRFLISDPDKLPKTMFGKYWLWQLFRSICILAMRNPILFLRNGSKKLEGNPIVIDSYAQIGRIKALIRLRSAYDQNVLKIKNASWIVKSLPANRIPGKKRKSCAA